MGTHSEPHLHPITQIHTQTDTQSHTHTQYKKITSLKRKEQRRSYETEKLDTGKWESHTQTHTPRVNILANSAPPPPGDGMK